MSINWVPASKTFDYRTSITCIYGDVDTGKSTLALTAKGPIYLLTTGEKMEGVIEEAAQNKEIHFHSFPGSFRSDRKGKARDRDIMDQAEAEMDLLVEHWIDAMGKGGSLVVDSHKDAKSLLTYSMFGNFKPPTKAEGGTGSRGLDYGPVNARWVSLLGEYRSQDFSNGSASNLILVGCTEDEYTNNKPTGKMIPKLHSSVRSKSQLILQTKVDRSNPDDPRFYAVVRKGWNNPTVKGKEFDVLIGEYAEDLGVEALPSIWGAITDTDPGEWM